MDSKRGNNRRFYLGNLALVVLVCLGFGASGCKNPAPSNTESRIELPASLTATSFSPAGDQSPEISQLTPFPTRSDAYQPIWGDFSAPGQQHATPIPPPLSGLNLSDEVLVWVLLGSDTEPPFTGRIQAIHLLFIHPRFSKASVVTIPGDLFVYIPGFTMQRLNTAYALGGIKTMRETLAYNFGVNPSRFVLAHPGDFQWLVDDLNQIEVTVFYPIPQFCGGIHAGSVTMDGTLALCYASFRKGMDEVDRMQRQQQLLRVIFKKLTHEGYLAKLPLLYASYDGWIKTDLSLVELMSYIPLSLRLADPDRINYAMIGDKAYILWEIPGYSQAKVFLPDRDEVKSILQQAINDIMEPQPLTNLVQTLAAQLTAVNMATLMPMVTQTPTPTGTTIVYPDVISTGGPLTPTPSPTITPPGYPDYPDYP